jgi:leucyl-tRNA synthetase
VLAHVRSTARVSGTLPESSPALKLSEEDLAIMHKTIKKVGEDCADIKFNTAVAALMEWLNHLSRKDVVSAQEYRTFVLLLAPFAPHIAEELWQSIRGQKADLSSDIGHLSSVHSQPWPEFDEKYLAGSSVTVVVQVNGRVRDNLVIESSKLTEAQYVEDQARKSAKVASYLANGEVKKVIYVPGKILNFVV